MQVLKRDGRKVLYDSEKVTNAVGKAFVAVDGELTAQAKATATKIASKIASLDTDIISVEEIQNIVEDTLMASKRKDVARAYIIYRNDRDRNRERNSKIMKDIESKLLATDVQNQNANLDERSFGGRMGSVNSEVMKKYALDNCVSPMARDNHLGNMIYIHDLDHYAIGDHNCMSCPIDDLLANGFNTRQTDVRPAQSINTAMQLVAVIFQLQSLQQFGGVSATHLDWSMVPYVRKSFVKHFKDGCKYLEPTANVDFVSDELGVDDNQYKEHQAVYDYALDMTEKECYQAVEGLYHNLD